MPGYLLDRQNQLSTGFATAVIHVVGQTNKIRRYRTPVKLVTGGTMLIGKQPNLDRAMSNTPINRSGNGFPANIWFDVYF